MYIKGAVGNRKKFILLTIFIILLLVVLFIIYVSYIYSKDCSTYECFKDHLASCRRAKFISEKEEATWGYEITGTAGSQCNVNVKLIQAKQGELGLNSLLGYEMVCLPDKGIVGYPESDLTKCHGILKEALQDIMINKLHTYIINNMGKINITQP